MRMPTTATELDAVVGEIRGQERFLVVGHENPDGDALGSMLAMTLALRSLGKDAGMFLASDGPLPAEYRFLELDGIRHEPPEDLAERVLLAVDCANTRRISEDETLVETAELVIDIDHHHDNTRFGDVNL